MTFKPPDCPKCQNRGLLRRYYNPSPDPVVSTRYSPKQEFVFKTEIVACDCYWGEQQQIIEDKMKHPEYENPFSKMSDDEIINTLNKASDNQRAIDSEFNI